jgi:hypothetical protein
MITLRASSRSIFSRATATRSSCFLGGSQVRLELLGLVFEALVPFQPSLAGLCAFERFPPVLHALLNRVDSLRNELGLRGEVEDDLARAEVGVLGRHTAGDLASLHAARERACHLHLAEQVGGDSFQLLEGGLPCRVELVQLLLERLDLVAGQHADVVFVLVVLLAGCSEQRRELGEAGALGLHLGEDLGELAREDVCIRNQLRSPTTGGNGLEVGLQLIDVAAKAPRI